ncbi:MAG: hypothetical protein ACTSUE_10355 [Promethearchaeota archaeon]
MSNSKENNDEISTGLHFLHLAIFLAVFILSSCMIYDLPTDVSDGLASLPPIGYEKPLLFFFSRIIFNNGIMNFFRNGTIIMAFLVVSPKRSKMISTCVVFFFFSWFFGLFVMSRIAPAVLEGLWSDVAHGITMTIMLIFLFTIIPNLVIKVVGKRLREKRSGGAGASIHLLTCPSCGTRYNSNPKICVKCLKEIPSKNEIAREGGDGTGRKEDGGEGEDEGEN